MATIALPPLLPVMIDFLPRRRQVSLSNHLRGVLRDLRLALADGLRASGRLAEARAVLEGLLQEYGRRQSRERAGLHLQIATVARAEKNADLAAKHLDKAAAVLLDSVDVQLALAEVAEERGELDRAEKAYRALLVLARHGVLHPVHGR